MPEIDTIGQLIGTYGFPIVMCGALFWLNIKNEKARREDNQKQEELRRQENSRLTEAVNNNTIALTELVTMLRK